LVLFGASLARDWSLAAAGVTVLGSVAPQVLYW